MAPIPTPTPTIERRRITASGQSDRSRDDRSRLSGLPIRILALLLAHGLATLTLLLSYSIWSDWRAAAQSVNPWLILGLTLLLCLNPFAALAISATLASPADALRIARSLTARPVMNGHRNLIILVALGITSAVLLASSALIVFLGLT